MAYGVGCLLAAYLALVFITANWHLPFVWSVDHIAWSFLPMLVAVACALLAQRQAVRFSVSMALGIIVSAFLLLLSLVNHLFPERSTLLSIAHLASVGGLLWLALRLYRRKNAL
jgi:hypothetical protein